MIDLLTQQNLLQKEGKEILEKLDLVNFLSQFGEVNIVGSYSLGLMVWRDIDFEVIVEKVDKEIFKKLANYLIDLDLVRIDFGFLDNRKRQNEKTPKGLYMGLKYYGEEIPVEKMLSANPLAW